MKKIRVLAFGKLLLAALGISLIVVGIAHAQLGVPTFTGKFRLINPVLWGKTVLQPGDYTVTIESISSPTAALIRDGSGRPIARFITGIDAGKTSAGNALLIREKGGQLLVYALAIPSLGKVLVYDRALAQEEVMEARGPRTVPVVLAKW